MIADRMSTPEPEATVSDELEGFENQNGFVKGDVLTFTVTVELGAGSSNLPPALDDLTHEAIAENIAAQLRGSGHRLLGITADKHVPMGEYIDHS